jgi:hypothetical protein
MFQLFVQLWTTIQSLKLKNEYEEIMNKYKQQLQDLGYNINSNLEIS